VSWHGALSLEVDVEFFRLGGGYLWHHIIEGYWVGKRRCLDRWSEYGRWWNKTTRGRAYVRKRAHEREFVLKKKIVSIRGCVVCGAPFALSAYRAKRGYDRVCSSPQCRGGLGNTRSPLIRIGTTSKTLGQWCRYYGAVSRHVAWTRIHEYGWTPERAVRTPPLHPGRRKGAGQEVAE
jgi:hypothetical protein